MSRHSPPLAAQRVAQALDKVASYALAIVAQEPLPQSAVAVALQQRLRLCILGCLHVDQSTAHPSRPAASDSLATTRRQQASSQQPTRVGKGKADASVSRQAPEARATRREAQGPAAAYQASVSLRKSAVGARSAGGAARRSCKSSWLCRPASLSRGTARAHREMLFIAPSACESRHGVAKPALHSRRGAFTGPDTQSTACRNTRMARRARGLIRLCAKGGTGAGDSSAALAFLEVKVAHHVTRTR